MTMQIESRDVLTGLAIPFGSPDRRDLQGEWFSKRTDLHLDWFPADGRPVLYHHGQDETAGGGVIGRQTSHEVREDGIWVETQLERRNKYVEMIRRLLDQGALGFSSGALPSLVKVAKATGEILSWPWVELSTTPTPASLDARIASKYLADTDALAGHAAAIDARATFERLNAMIAGSSAAEARKTVGGYPIDPDTGLPDIGRPDEARVKAIATAAARKMAETGDPAAAVAELFAGIERTR